MAILYAIHSIATLEQRLQCANKQLGILEETLENPSTVTKTERELWQALKVTRRAGVELTRWLDWYTWMAETGELLSLGESDSLPEDELDPAEP